MHESFIVYARLRWFKVALLVAALAIAAYALHNPTSIPNGGTWLGYTLGTVGALLIVWLAWLGIRKRQYSSELGSVKGWLSAHIYLGSALLVIATLHTGFQFGINVHTLAYALMVLVILSGMWGVVVYSRYPSLITANRSSRTLDSLVEELADLDQQVLELSDKVEPDIHETIRRSVEKTRLGGGFWAQLIGSSGLKMMDQALQLLESRQQDPASGSEEAPAPFDGGATMFFVASAAAGGGSDRSQAETIRKLLNLMGRRKALIEQINRDVTQRARMQGWLYLHVPLSIALLGALLVHILSVFLYW